MAAAEGSGGDAVTRGIPLKLRASPRTEDVDTAELAMLPRLPDTRQELTAMANALDVDPAKVLYLGKDANEQNVETIDLSHVRIIAFATHGLVPGDLNGLTQPALALTAPDVAGVTGNGLLTMEKIFASSSTPIGWCCRPATPRRAQGPARKPLPVSAALFSTPAPAPC